MSTLSLRLPESLHKGVRELAEREGVSMNQLIVTAVAEKMSALVTEEYLLERAQRGSREAYEAALRHVPDAEPEERDARQLRVFLSASPADREMALNVQQKLTRAGARVFSSDMLGAGEKWQAKLRDKLAESEVFVLVLSASALESSLVLQEVGAAWALGKKVIVVTVGEDVTLPAGLDISADVVVTELSALDDLAQLTGRLRRTDESLM